MFGEKFSQQKKAEYQMPQPKFYGIIFSQDSITISQQLLDPR
ncbi:hypothetical protein ACXOJ4_00620 [Streptococcus thermophilus]